MKRFKVLSLAALVAFGACDEGSEPIIEPTPTGTISGVVTIEGQAASGVSVTLSSGASATTDGSGAYSFSGVNAGAYTVSISGFASDATFSSTAKAATITAAGQVVTVNFDGAFVRTSAILGSVTAGGQGLAGVKVDIGSASVNTDANGQYAFSGLRAGTYTVTISGFNAGQYTFASTSSSVTLGVGESKVASFTGQLIATANITGAVTIDGAAAAGVTATLSTGAVATTDAAGAYAFTNLTAGNYVVTISGFAADAQFESVAKPVVITSAGSTVTANFAGAFIKTSSITGSVSVSGTGIAGVKVTLSNGATVNTDANGQYSFAALRAGTYTVTISGWDATMYTFATTSADVTVATGESAVQSFAGAFVATAKISGMLYIDENDKNDTFDGASLEDAYKLAGVTITIEGGAVNNTTTTTTDANGAFEFAGLVPGTYRVTITPPAAPALPALPTLVYGGASTNSIVTLAPGGTATVNFPFDINTQKVQTFVFLGTDSRAAGMPGPGHTAVPSATVDLFDTQANAANHIAVASTTGRLGTAVTDANGGVTITYLRTADTSPAGAADDNIVYAVARTGNLNLPSNYGINGENIIEIKFNAKDSLVSAPDTFDVLNGNVVLKFAGREIDGDSLKGWNYRVILNDTITPNVNSFGGLGATNGDLVFSAAVNPTILPQTFYFDLAGAQALANGHAFSQTPVASGGMARGHFLAFTHAGLKLSTDTVMVGSQQVKYLDADVVIRVHNESDDTMNYTGGDALPAAFNDIQINRLNGTAFQLALPVPTTGIVTFPNTKVDTTFTYRAVRNNAVIDILNDTIQTFMLDGSSQSDTIQVLKGSKGFSSFMFKYNNTAVSGSVAAADGTVASGIKVRVKPAANNIQPRRASNPDTTVTVTAGGVYAVTGLREGPYEVTVFDSVTAAGDSIWSFLTGSVASGSKTTTVDLQGNGTFNGAVGFTATRMDTQVKGVIVNDRDADGNVIDIDEALVGAQVQLYRDGSGAAVPPAIGTTFGRDTLIATATTDATGGYSFGKLREGRYMVRWVGGTPASPSLDVLRALSTDSVIVYTAATTVGSGANNTRVVGTTTPATLPRWDYPNSAGIGVLADPAHFMFLYKNTVAKGTVKTAGAVAIPGMTISLRRCNVAAPTVPASPPSAVAQTCGTSYLGTTVNVISDATGAFEFPNLTEGVYEIRPQPTTVAGWNTSAPSSTLYLLVGNGDIESLDFVIS